MMKIIIVAFICILSDEITNVHGAVNAATVLWPGGVIPYELDDSFKNNLDIMKSLPTAISEYTKNTCIKFIPRTDQKNYIKVKVVQESFSGCGTSTVGMKTDGDNAVQFSANSGCTSVNTILHEFMHAIGFNHEMERPDRDDYIIMINNTANMDPDLVELTKGEPDKLTWEQAAEMTKKYPYDICSIMHYEPSADFFKMKYQNYTDAKAATREGSSFTVCDIAKINFLYNCIGKNMTCTTIKPDANGKMACAAYTPYV